MKLLNHVLPYFSSSDSAFGMEMFKRMLQTGHPSILSWEAMPLLSKVKLLFNLLIWNMNSLGWSWWSWLSVVGTVESNRSKYLYIQRVFINQWRSFLHASHFYLPLYYISMFMWGTLNIEGEFFTLTMDLLDAIFWSGWDIWASPCTLWIPMLWPVVSHGVSGLCFTSLALIIIELMLLCQLLLTMSSLPIWFIYVQYYN